MVKQFEFLNFEVTYTNVVDKEQQKFTCAAATDRIAAQETPLNYVVDVGLARNRQVSAEAMEAALNFARERKIVLAKSALDDAVGTIKASPSGRLAMSQDLAKELETFAESFKDNEAYVDNYEHGAAMQAMTSYSSTQTTQRVSGAAACVAPSQASVYSTPSRMTASLEYSKHQGKP